MDVPKCSQNYVITMFIDTRAMDTCRTSFGNIQHLIDINETLQLKVPPRMLSTLSFLLPRLPVVAVREVQRTTLVSNGNAKSSVTIFDALPIPVHPTTFTNPTFTSEASNGDAKELVVRRMIDSSNHGRISRHQISVRFSVQHLLVSTTEARVTSWRACRKNDLDNSSVAKRPEHRQDHLLFDNTEKTTRHGCPKLDAPTLPGSRKLQSHRHTEPYRRIRRCRSQAIHTLQHFGPHAMTNGRTGVRAQRLHPPAYCFKPPASPQVTRDGWQDQQKPMSFIHKRLSSYNGASFFHEQYHQTEWKICSHHPLS